MASGNESDYLERIWLKLSEIYTQLVAGLTTTFAGLRNGGRITHISIDALAWYPAPLAVLNPRGNLTVQNISGNAGTVLWNYDNAAPATEGYRIEDGGHKSVLLDGAVVVYVRMLAGVGEVVVDEVG